MVNNIETANTRNSSMPKAESVKSKETSKFAYATTSSPFTQAFNTERK